MLDTVDILSTDKVLDLGCGYGLVGVYAAGIVGPENVVMADVNPLATKYAAKNAALNGYEEGSIRIYTSDGFSEIPDRDFTLILNNPPFHEDFHIAKTFIENGIKHLKINGRMVMVTKRRKWYENKLRSVFGGVKVYEVGEYFVFVAEKREKKSDNNNSEDQKRVERGKKDNEQHLSKKLNRKMNKIKQNK